MVQQQLLPILNQFVDVSSNQADISPLGNGLIHDTYLYRSIDGAAYVLQQFNQNVFPSVDYVMYNVQVVSDHPSVADISYKLPAYLSTKSGCPYAIDSESGLVWRMWPFVEGITISTIDAPELAYNTSKTFGEFFYALRDLPAEKLYHTIPFFHSRPIRYQQFVNASKRASSERLELAQPLLNEIEEHPYTETFLRKQIPLTRIMHHDAKIDNILFRSDRRTPVGILDLDTLMPGNITSDFGDLVRTSICSMDENSENSQELEIDFEIYQALKEGYLSPIESVISGVEKEELCLAGADIIYMQLLRFLTDFLQNDTYYKVENPTANLRRSWHQYYLLKSLLDFRSKW